MRPAGGFTLIEIVVVLFIVGMLSTLAVVSLSPSSTMAAEREARQLVALLELASVEARASGRTIAWSAEPIGYSFWVQAEGGEWKPFPETSPYRHRMLEAGSEITRVSADSRAVASSERVYLTPYGLRPQIEVTIRNEDSQIVLRGSVLGQMEIERASE